MPAKSEQQRKWAFASKGMKWARAHHFDNQGKLPKYAHGPSGIQQPRKRRVKFH